MSEQRSEREENALLANERLAILEVLKNIFNTHNVPSSERDYRVALACVALGAEMWGRLHPELPQEGCAIIYGEIAEEALRGWHDLNVYTFTKPADAKGLSDA
jgi:hypothetical protein